MKKNKFSEAKFRKFHPGGHIGKQLITCKEIMYSGKNNLPIVGKKNTIEETIKVITKKSLGVAVVTKGNKKVIGYVSDGDIRRCKFSKNIRIKTRYKVLQFNLKKSVDLYWQKSVRSAV